MEKSSLISNMVHKINQRREHLGISQTRLAEMTGISLPTIQRFFSDNGAKVSLETASKIAEVLGLNLTPKEIIDEQTLLEKHARKKARWLTSVVQGTSSLEAQGLTGSSAKAVEQRFFYELMAGPKSKIWSA